jgi:hypothetical protein
MKTTWYVFLVIVVCSSVSYGQNNNKATNGSLEKVVKSKPGSRTKNRPDGWVEWGWAPQKAKAEFEVVIVDGKGRNDSRCVKISVKKAGHVGVLCNIYSQINTAGGKKYVLKVYVKTIKEDPAKEFQLSVGNVGTEKIKFIKKYKLFPTEGWQLLSFPIVLPAGDYNLRIDLQLKNRGTVFIDDIYFGESTGEEK